ENEVLVVHVTAWSQRRKPASGRNERIRLDKVLHHSTHQRDGQAVRLAPFLSSSLRESAHSHVSLTLEFGYLTDTDYHSRSITRNRTPRRTTNRARHRCHDPLRRIAPR